MRVGRIEQLTHTPGPWKAEDYGPLRVGDCMLSHQIWGRKRIAFTESQNVGLDAAKANARLIAAAPDLLDVLLRIHERLTDGRDVPEWMSGWAEEVGAAIQKAEQG